MINDYPFEMSNFEMMLSLKWYMTVSSKGATAPSILLKWYFERQLSFARLRRVPSSCRLNSDQIQSANTRLKNSLLILLRWSMTIVSKWAAQFCIRFDMIYDFRFEMSDSYLNRFEMIYLLSFRNERRKNFRTENHFRQRGYLKFSWRKRPLNPIFSYTDFFAATVP